jgi:phage tail sheath protein FI
MVCTGVDADASMFPLNKLVLLTDVLTSIGKAGESVMLARSLDAIADQAKPVTVVVSVAQGETEAGTTSNMSAYGCKTVEEVIAYRDNFSQREGMLIWPDFISFDTELNADATAYASACALGQRAKIVEQTGWH